MVVDPQKKARDADRDAAVEVVEAAFADGQISRADYDLRVDRLLSAGTVGEVQALVHDLRRDPHDPTTDVVEAVTEDKVEPPPPPPSLPRDRLPPGTTARRSVDPSKVGAVITVVGVLVVLGIVLAVALPIWLFSRGGDDGVSTGNLGLGDEVSLVTPEGYDLFADALEEETGSLEAFSVVLYPGYAVVDVPADATSQRKYGRYWNGDWSDFGGSGTSSDDRFSVDQVDGQVIADGVRRAKAAVEDPTSWYAIIRAPDADVGGTCVTAYASNEFNESGFVRLTCDGAVVD